MASKSSPSSSSTSPALKKRQERPGFQFLKRQLQVEEWLEKVFNQKFDKANSDHFVKDQLKNGVLLCKLMLLIDERSLPHYHAKPNSPLKVRDNLFLFIEACSDIGVPKHRLFSEEDLYQGRNLIRVLDTLESLSDIACSEVGTSAESSDTKEPKRKRFAIPIEHLKDDEIDFADESMQEAEDSINQIKAPSKSVANLLDRRGSIVEKKVNLLISERGGKASEVEKAVTSLQALVRGKRVRKEYQKNARLQSFRTCVAKEILTTEELYINNLKTLIKLYKVPLTENASSKKAFITEDQVRLLFSDIEIILGYNQQLLEDMTPRIKSWSPSQCLGDIFLRITNFLKVYTGYVQNYDVALETIGICKKNPKFAAFIESCRVSPEGNLQTLEMLLINPIQRIPRYNLLLSELLKYTWKDHKDYKNLELSQARMKEVATYVNDKKREFENIAKVRQVQEEFDESLDANLVDPSRKFIRRDVVAQWTGSNDSDKKINELVLILFNDLLVVAIPREYKLKFKESFKIGRIHIHEPKLRKWTLKKNDMGKLWPKKEVKPIEESTSLSSSSSLSPSQSPTSSPSKRDSRRMSFGIFGRSMRKDSIARFYSVRNTLELNNSADENLLKVCFDSPLLHASWSEDFKATKAEVDQISKFQEEKALERALKKSENLKSDLLSKLSTTKSMEERKAEWRTSKGGGLQQSSSSHV
eukprot:TRINITY_DN3996_c0_g1_i1.p1 TRINITY_DN3996_c0_g1~~TRINITY_DN3996_c0_g1_i1.p1  ORF type:complete len:701 (-),score=169.13 TRINITY_DN3996_c0_g1_i1:41-2143(-)